MEAISEEFKGILRNGLMATPKRIPGWFLYDKEGSAHFDRLQRENPHYYMHRCEVNAIKSHVKDIINTVKSPCKLMDLGSGNPEKAKIFLDHLLKKQESVHYIPVDISSEYLQEASRELMLCYRETVQVDMIAGDYSVGIKHLGTLGDCKLIIWLGGLQALPYSEQVGYLADLAKYMTDNDRVLLSLDVTHDPVELRKAYDITGLDKPVYMNGLSRLNRDYGSEINTDQFELEFKFVHNIGQGLPSYTDVRARSLIAQEYPVPGLDLTLSFEKDECINMYEGEGSSFKYTQEQVEALGRKANMRLTNVWYDDTKHIGLFVLAKV